jgi:hypothetical protein
MGTILVVRIVLFGIVSNSSVEHSVLFMLAIAGLGFNFIETSNLLEHLFGAFPLDAVTS